MERRRFLELAGLGLCGSLVTPKLAFPSEVNRTLPSHDCLYGSGHFGKWITDSFGMRAYQYTCNQTTDPKAVLPLDKAWRAVQNS